MIALTPKETSTTGRLGRGPRPVIGFNLYILGPIRYFANPPAPADSAVFMFMRIGHGASERASIAVIAAGFLCYATDRRRALSPRLRHSGPTLATCSNCVVTPLPALGILGPGQTLTFTITDRYF